MSKRLINVPDAKCKIEVEVDEEKNNEKILVDGNLHGILMGLAILVKQLKESKIPENLIKKTVETGLGKENEEKIKIQEIKVTKENEEEVKKLLEK